MHDTSAYEIQAIRAGITRDNDEAVELAAAGRKITIAAVRGPYLLPGFAAEVTVANNSDNDPRARIEYMTDGNFSTAEAEIIAGIAAKAAALAAAVDAYWVAREITDH